MSELTRPTNAERGWLDRFARRRPDWLFMAPFMLYLLLLGLKDLEAVWGENAYQWRWAASVIRGVLPLWLVWRWRRHYPDWGRPYWAVAVIGAVAATLLWAGGQHLLNAWGVPHTLPGPFFGDLEVVNPADKLGTGGLYWSTIVTRIACAVVTVPVVEELFWRAFLLRALINWNNFEEIPLGRFTWFSFLGTALLSTIQHPHNWLVSIFCWMWFNYLFYRTRSIWCLIIVHGLTNLLLYLYVVAVGDWQFW